MQATNAQATNALKIANAFLAKVPVNAVKAGDGISKLKLQKLLFFAQEEFLYKHNRPLFDEKIEAWEHGPVVRSVWNEFAEQNKIISIRPKNVNLDSLAQEIVDMVWAKYGDKDTWKLREITHSYEIWQNARKQGTNIEITPDEILQYKRAQVEARHKACEHMEKILKELQC